MSVHKPTSSNLSRRDFLKAAGLGVATALGLSTGILGGPSRAEALPLNFDNPHTYTPLFPKELWAGMYVKPDGQLDRVEAPAEYFQNGLDEKLKVNVSWKASQKEKPEFPDHCTVTFSNGENSEPLPILMMKTVVLEKSKEPQIDAGRLDAGDTPGLQAVFDNNSKSVLITDLQGNVVRVVPAPNYWEKKLPIQDGYKTHIPYETNNGQKLTGPKGIALITSIGNDGQPIGDSSEHFLENTPSVKVLLPIQGLPFVPNTI